MKAFKTYLKIICLFFILNSTSMLAQWEKCNGPSGVNVHAITVFGDSILAGTDTGIILSTNNGADWTMFGLNGKDIRTLVSNAYSIYAGTQTGAYSWSFETQSWVESNNGIGYNKTVGCLAKMGNSIFAGITQGGVYKSIDNAATWKVMGIKNYGILNIAVMGNSIYVNVSGGGVYQSADNGNTWSEVAGLANKNVQCFAGSDGKLFAGTDIGVLFSQDNGTSWIEVNNGLKSKSIHTLCLNGSQLFAGTNSGIFLSVNNGTSWTEINSGLSSRIVNCFTVKGNLLFAGTSGGVFVSSNNGEIWNELNTNIKFTADEIANITINGDRLFATSVKSIYRTSNQGNSWTKLVQFDNYLRCLAVTDSIIIAGTWDGGIISSIDQGITWVDANNGIPSLESNDIVVDGNRIFAAVSSSNGKSGGVYVSTNNGKLWVSAGLKNYDVTRLVIMDSTILAATWMRGMQLSTNNGKDWATVDTTKDVWCLKKVGSNIFAGTSEGVLRSIDSGATWTAANKGISDLNVASIAISGNKIFIGTKERGLFVSKNNGKSWIETNNGIAITYIPCLEISDNILFMGTSDYSMLKARIEDLVSVDEIAIPNNAISIYPNPAQNTLNIRLDKESAIATSVKVLDVCGRTVAESQIPAGSMELTLDVKELPVGIYLLNLVTGNEVKTEKFGVWR